MSRTSPSDDAAPHALADGTRLAVRAGDPGPEELAALVAALDAGTGERRARPAPPAWQRAARLEDVGAGRLGSPAALAQAEADGTYPAPRATAPRA